MCEADFLTHVPLPGRPGGLSVRGANTVEAVGEMSKSQKRRRKAEKARDGTSEMVDVVVCCLSLMGTNWVGGIYEACRILKQGYVRPVYAFAAALSSKMASGTQDTQKKLTIQRHAAHCRSDIPLRIDRSIHRKSLFVWLYAR